MAGAVADAVAAAEGDEATRAARHMVAGMLETSL